MAACDCDTPLNNTGEVTCQTLFKVAKKLILVPTFDNAGARNRIDLSLAVDQTLIDANINQTDASKRWYPTPTIEAVTSERGDPVFEEAPSGRSSKTKEGTRDMAFQVWDQGPVYKQQLDAVGCGNISFFIIDLDGNLRGRVLDSDATDFLYPITIDKNSWNAGLMFGTDDTIEKLQVQFDWDQTMDDALLREIAKSSMDVNMLEIAGLIDVTGVFTLITTTGFTVTLNTLFGDIKDPITDKGVLITEVFDAPGGTPSNVFNITDTAAEPLATFVETPAGSGTYVATYTAPVTSLDTLRMTVVRNGRDYTKLFNLIIATP